MFIQSLQYAGLSSPTRTSYPIIGGANQDTSQNNFVLFVCHFSTSQSQTMIECPHVGSETQQVLEAKHRELIVWRVELLMSEE